MNDITPKEASEILSHYTNLGYGVVIEGEDISKIKQALSLASKTLAKGTPITDGDCISREALKKDIEKRCGEPFDYIKTIVPVLNAVDNAQAIPLPSEQIAWEQGYEAGLSQGKHDRPQGEWIKNSTGEWTCSNCYNDADYLDGGTALLSPYCPYCGAIMRGKINETN